MVKLLFINLPSCQSTFAGSKKKKNHFSTTVCLGRGKPHQVKGSQGPFHSVYVCFRAHISAHCTNKRPSSVSFGLPPNLSWFFGTTGVSLQASSDVMGSVKQHGLWQRAKPTSNCFVVAVWLVIGASPRMCHTVKQWGKLYIDLAKT